MFLFQQPVLPRTMETLSILVIEADSNGHAQATGSSTRSGTHRRGAIGSARVSDRTTSPRRPGVVSGRMTGLCVSSQSIHGESVWQRSAALHPGSGCGRY